MIFNFFCDFQLIFQMHWILLQWEYPRKVIDKLQIIQRLNKIGDLILCIIVVKIIFQVPEFYKSQTIIKRC